MKHYIPLLSIFLFSSLFGANVNIKMNGVLDDDIFIYQVQADSTNIVKLYAAQMHNPAAEKNVDGQSIPTKKIDYDGKINIDLNAKTENGIIVVSTANEREEIYPGRSITQRTHYKSSPVYANNIEVIRSILPEKDDLFNYPKLFQDGEKSCVTSAGTSENGNYYKMWENAVIANAIILQKPGNYKATYFDSQGNVKKRLKFFLNEGQIFDGKKTVVNEMEEIYGDVYKNEQSLDYNLYLVQQNSIDNIVIWNEDTGESYRIPFVYKWAYPGLIRFFVPKQN